MGGTSTDVALVQGLTPADRARDQGRRPHRARVQCGRPHGRRGRRLDRARAGADEGAAGRPAVGGRRPRACRVRQGRRRTDRHRRQRRARLPPAVAGGRRDRARRRRRAGGGADRRRRHGPGVGRGRGGGHRRHRQREHARRPAPGVGAAGLRPPGVRPGRVRRRGPVARQRLGQADRGVAGDRAAVAGRAVRVGRRDDVGPQRVGPHRAATLRRRRRPARDPRRARRRGGRGPRRAGRARRAADHRVPGGRALPRAGLRDPDRGGGAGPRGARGRVRRRARAALLVPAHRGPRAGQRPRDGDRAAAVGLAGHAGEPATVRRRRATPIRSSSRAVGWTPRSTTGPRCGPTT